MRPEGVFTPSPVTLVGALVLGVVDFRAVWATTETTVIARIIATAIMYLVILSSFASPSHLHNLKHRGHGGIQGSVASSTIPLLLLSSEMLATVSRSHQFPPARLWVGALLPRWSEPEARC